MPTGMIHEALGVTRVALVAMQIPTVVIHVAMVVMHEEAVVSPGSAGAMELPGVGTPHRTGVMYVAAAGVRSSVGPTQGPTVVAHTPD